ncbi:hypothetical protein DMC30DRAFT_413901 [Rhodotorula diobovata]|uniref:Uncharacterized protein n=1 Tax=Rhodotorula diobovata TaxID=5288 RepID=A0A5C5G3Q4_9BASI|nr:hypothetical protein DMC30DRAFT_413901 [Rhodotorula diobovata]
MFSWLFGSRPSADSASTRDGTTPTSASSSSTGAPPSTDTAPTSPLDARTARNRKKRQQKKKSAQRHKRHASLAGGGGADDDAADDDDDDAREPDEDEVGAPAPEADDDLSYLERIGGLRRQREDKARELAAAGAAVAGTGGAVGVGAGAGAGTGAVAAGLAGASDAPRAGGSSAGARVGGAGPASSAAAPPLRDAFALPGEAPLDTRGVTAGPEQIEAAQLVGAMLAQGKIRPGASGALNRISGLPDGAGQVNGIEVPSTHEVRRKARDNGLIPFTDDKGMLRIGVRVAPDVVLMHPKDGKGEPILLRM